MIILQEFWTRHSSNRPSSFYRNEIAVALGYRFDYAWWFSTMSACNVLLETFMRRTSSSSHLPLVCNILCVLDMKHFRSVYLHCWNDPVITQFWHRALIFAIHLYDYLPRVLGKMLFRLSLLTYLSYLWWSCVKLSSRLLTAVHVPQLGSFTLLQVQQPV